MFFTHFLSRFERGITVDSLYIACRRGRVQTVVYIREAVHLQRKLAERLTVGEDFT